ncbi:MAG: histidinol-phosphatase HisJ family protein [Melioribacteraceae bacterium]|nr:histidinol-phosphatase HisJ family protein [Melioribacteraceae bacterium]
MTDLNPFIWETHGIHIGTGNDHVKHGVDDVEKIVNLAIEKGHPSITFIIHTPRLTRIRYKAERETDIKFIRGDNAYFEYPERIENLKKKYNDKIDIKYGIELEWLGGGLGLQWNRAKVFQAKEADFVIGSVHFSKEGIPYDGSKEETNELLELRGSLENYWAGYIEEVIEMIDSSWDMIHVVGHLDLPKLYVPVPEPLVQLNTSSHFLARRMRVLLEMISDHNLALDVNMAGLKKGCGVYPGEKILERAASLNIPVTIGTDTHAPSELGDKYKEGIDYLHENGFKNYVSYSKSIPEQRPLINSNIEDAKYKVLNLGIEILNRRFSNEKRKAVPQFAFGASYRTLLTSYNNSTSLGSYDAIRVRKGKKSVTIGKEPQPLQTKNQKSIFSYHVDKPGILSRLFNTLASEEINVETAFLNSNADGTATAFLTVSGNDDMISEALEFIKGTTGGRFLELKYGEDLETPSFKEAGNYLLEIDGVDLPIPISKQMIISVHKNSAGVLLILLSALASANINVKDLQLGERGGKGYAAIGVEADEKIIQNLLTQLGPQFYEVSHLVLNNIE